MASTERPPRRPSVDLCLRMCVQAICRSGQSPCKDLGELIPQITRMIVERFLAAAAIRCRLVTLWRPRSQVRLATGITHMGEGPLDELTAWSRQGLSMFTLGTASRCLHALLLVRIFASPSSLGRTRAFWDGGLHAEGCSLCHDLHRLLALVGDDCFDFVLAACSLKIHRRVDCRINHRCRVGGVPRMHCRGDEEFAFQVDRVLGLVGQAGCPVFPPRDASVRGRSGSPTRHLSPLSRAVLSRIAGVLHLSDRRCPPPWRASSCSASSPCQSLSGQSISLRRWLGSARAWRPLFSASPEFQPAGTQTKVFHQVSVQFSMGAKSLCDTASWGSLLFRSVLNRSPNGT